MPISLAELYKSNILASPDMTALNKWCPISLAEIYKYNLLTALSKSRSVVWSFRICKTPGPELFQYIQHLMSDYSHSVIMFGIFLLNCNTIYILMVSNQCYHDLQKIFCNIPSHCYHDVLTLYYEYVFLLHQYIITQHYTKLTFSIVS